MSLYYPALLSGNIYLAIFICKNIQKTWILFIYNKNKFIVIFQAWLPGVETESGCLRKALRVDG